MVSSVHSHCSVCHATLLCRQATLLSTVSPNAFPPEPGNNLVPRIFLWQSNIRVATILDCQTQRPWEPSWAGNTSHHKVTQRFFPLSGDERCVTTQKTVAQENINYQQRKPLVLPRVTFFPTAICAKLNNQQPVSSFFSCFVASILSQLEFIFLCADTTLARCYAKVEGNRCSEPLMRFLTLSQCCCGMEKGGQRGWDDPCTPCPTKGSGRLNILKRRYSVIFGDTRVLSLPHQHKFIEN